MSIDYNSGSGLFDKVGKVVSMVNALETWETSTSSGNLEKNFQLLEAVLEDGLQFDRSAKDLMYQKWNAYKSQIDQMKVRFNDLTRYLMASEIVIQDHFDSDSLSDLVQYLQEAMIRDLYKVTANTVAVDVPIISTACSPYVVIEPRPGFTSSMSDPSIAVDNFNVEVVNVDVVGSEQITLSGTIKSSFVGSPLFAYAGNIVNNYTLRNLNSKNLIPDGAFLLVDSSNHLSQWTPMIGVWGTDISMVQSTTHDLAPSVLRFASTKNGRLACNTTIPNSSLKTRTLYVGVIVMAVGAAADGTVRLDLGLNDGGLSHSLGVYAGLTVQYTAFYQTGDQTKNLNVSIAREAATADTLDILGVGLFEMIPTDVGWFCALNTCGLGFNTLKYLSSLGIPGDQTPGASANDHAGKFQTYFARFLNVLIPSYGSWIILDTLAA